MKAYLSLLCILLGSFNGNTLEVTKSTILKSKSIDLPDAATSIKGKSVEPIKDKREITNKLSLYPNHRNDRANSDADDPELPEETIYGPKPNQFIIRPVPPHQHNYHESHQEPQLRHFVPDVRPHAAQILDQHNQEMQRFLYLQDIARNQQKTTAQGKSLVTPVDKAVISPGYNKDRTGVEEAEQRPYGQHQKQQLQQQPPLPYQIIPEDQFLRLLEEELQARTYNDEKFRSQKQNTPVTQKQLQQPEPSIFQERLSEPQTGGAQYVHYVPQHIGGPKYLPTTPQPRQLTEEEMEHPQQHLAAQALPPQIAYYQPQISYKTLPNHPLAKSSLENEIEKLLAANKQTSVGFVDNANEPSIVNNQQHTPHRLVAQTQAHPTSPALRQQKAYIANTTPNSLLDANNQPFIPSLFKFSNFQAPTPIYPTQVPRDLIEPKKLGPVVYPPSTPASIAPQPSRQPSQYYYQETPPNAKAKSYRPKHYTTKIPTPVPSKTALIYDYDQPQGQPQFYPSPPDPIKHSNAPLPTQPQPVNYPQQYPLPHVPASQSSIYVAQGTGIRPSANVSKPKSAEDVKQLHLPQPGGKPLTQAQFQALVDAGYPVTAVPVPVPVPFEQYVKDHPEYRNHPPIDYAHLMRLATRQFSTNQRSPVAVPSEPSVKVVSSTSSSELQASNYLRPVGRRHPREDKETGVVGGDPIKSL